MSDGQPSPHSSPEIPAPTDAAGGMSEYAIDNPCYVPTRPGTIDSLVKSFTVLNVEPRVDHPPKGPISPEFDEQPSPHNSPEVAGPDTTGGTTVEPIDPLLGIDPTGDENSYTIDELVDQGYCGFEIHSNIYVESEKICWPCMMMLGAERAPFFESPEEAKEHARMHVGTEGELVGFMEMQTTTSTNNVSYRTCPGCSWNIAVETSSSQKLWADHVSSCEAALRFPVTQALVGKSVYRAELVRELARHDEPPDERYFRDVARPNDS